MCPHTYMNMYIYSYQLSRPHPPTYLKDLPEPRLQRSVVDSVQEPPQIVGIDAARDENNLPY